VKKSERKSLANKSTVHPSILLSIAMSNLLSKKLRTGLTVFGIAIGIGAIFFLLSFGIGLQRLVTNQVIGNQSIKTIDVSSPNAGLVKIDDVNTNRIKEIPNVDTVGQAYYFPGSFKISGSESDGIVYGVDQPYQSLTYLNLIEGSLLGDETEKSGLIINKAALEAIGLAGKPADVIGKPIEVTIPLSNATEKAGTLNKELPIVGVIDSGSGAELFVSNTIFREAGVKNITQLKVGARNVEDVKTIRAQIESLGLETSSPVDTLNEINQVFKFLNFILIGFGSIGMVVAVLGMFNTLTISLLERTREIGLMVALGARSVDMRRLFVLEAMLLSFIGSVVGILGAYLIGRIVNTIMNVFALRRGVRESFDLFASPPLMILAMVIFMTFVGLIVVYLPARRAEKINPIDALRRE